MSHSIFGAQTASFVVAMSGHITDNCLVYTSWEPNAAVYHLTGVSRILYRIRHCVFGLDCFIIMSGKNFHSNTTVVVILLDTYYFNRLSADRYRSCQLFRVATISRSSH